MIGQSHYPWWHGTLNDLRDNLIFMSKTYDKDIMIVEAAYNWAPAEYLNSPAPFAESPEGAKGIPGGSKPCGNGHTQRTRHWYFLLGTRGGPPFQRRKPGGRGFFGPEGNALPVMTVFDKFTRGRPQQPAKKMQ